MVLLYCATSNNWMYGLQIPARGFYRVVTSYTLHKFWQEIESNAALHMCDMKDIERAIDEVGGLPVVVKVTQGTQGQGVALSIHFVKLATWYRDCWLQERLGNPRIHC